MPGTESEDATLYRRMPDSTAGERQMEKTFAGSVRDCLVYLHSQPERDRDAYFAELKDGTPLSSADIERIASNRNDG